jgi:hypothetical protein
LIIVKFNLKKIEKKRVEFFFKNYANPTPTHTNTCIYIRLFFCGEKKKVGESFRLTFPKIKLHIFSFYFSFLMIFSL